MSKPISSALLAALCAADFAVRAAAGAEIYRVGRSPADDAVSAWRKDGELSALLLGPNPTVNVGLAVLPETFARIHVANGAPRFTDVPPEQDAREFELHFPGGASLDILTTREPGGSGAIARYLKKFGEGVQQVELRCLNVARATVILRERFGVAAVYEHGRVGGDGTRVNFFLVSLPAGHKVLIELYELNVASQH